MRHLMLSLVTLAALTATGCGVSPVGSAKATRPASMAAASLVEEGTIVFDKDLVYRTVDILGVGATYEAALGLANVKTVKQLLLAGGTPTQRKHLAEDTGISPKLLLTWINMADLMRIDGIGPEFAELLEAAGVDTVKELAQRNAANLTAKLAETHAKKGLTRTVPSEKQVDRWIDEAKGLTPAVSH